MDQQGQPLISIDVVPLRFSRRSRSVEVLLAERVFAPSLGEPALPGVLLLAQELLADAVHRALRDKAGVYPEHVWAVGDVGVFDTPGRDPRGPTLSITRYCIVGSEFEPPAGVAFVELAKATSLPFDHEAIIRRAAHVVGERLWVDLEVTQALLDQQFSTKDAADVRSSLAQSAEPPLTTESRAHLARTLAKNPWLEQTGDAAPVGDGRPALLWRFV